MNPPKRLLEDILNDLIQSAETMTQEQIDACAWAMGGSGCGWNREKLIEALREDIKKLTES